MNTLTAFWGKARAVDGASSPVHPCLYHSLDVAAVGSAILEMRPDLSAWFADILGLPVPQVRVLLSLLLSLHDVGKISSPFQAQAPEHWPTAALGSFCPAAATGIRHDRMGLHLLSNVVSSDDVPALVNLTKPYLRTNLLSPIVGHHGRPVKQLEPGEGSDERCKRFVSLFCMAMNDVFKAEPLPNLQKAVIARLSWRLAGLTVLADWIGSNQLWFPYELPDHEPACYFETIARPRALHALKQAGILPSRPGTLTGFRSLTKREDCPSPVQGWAERVSLPEGPVLVLIEDMTGSGKTEAALVLAARMIAAGKTRGLSIALPTMATANGMFTRVASIYRRLFAPGTMPSLILAHSASRLHKGFRTTFFDAPRTASPAQSEGEADSIGDDAGAASAAWLADQTRKVFLADVGVGTIDQALLAVLPAKYQSLRLFGLAERVLVVDEAHAYDPYMDEELTGLLRFQAALGGSAIVLSATLPHSKRQRLASAFAEGCGSAVPLLRENAYPLATMVSPAGVTEVASATRPDLPRRLSVVRLADEQAAEDHVRTAAAAGAAVLWIRNTVDDVLAAASTLRADGQDVAVFHARFAMGDRLAVEERIVARFGPRGNLADRPGILVASQVVEQSLDLDFDAMVSDLAPVDLLLQRAGRLWRHSERPRPILGPTLAVVSPEPGDSVGSRWYKDLFPRAAWVYRDHALLWLTAKTFFARAAWKIPEDVRFLIESVEEGLTRETFPTGLNRNFAEARGNESAERSHAKSNLLRFRQGYVAGHEAWDAEVRVPTRLGEEMTTLRLARWEAERLVPWCADADPHRAWSLSEVSVRKTRANSAPFPDPLKAAAQHARRGWTRFDEEKLLVPLEEAPEAPGLWSGEVRDDRGDARPFTYTRTEGLRWMV